MRQFSRTSSTFAALNYKNFRIYWIALAISACGTWMQIVAQSLLVLSLTHGSAAALGLVALAQASAFFLFALVGGSFADTIDRRRLLLITNTLLLLVALTLGLLTSFGVIRVWMIVVLAFCSGSLLSFDQPARTSFLPSLVPEHHLVSAIALQSMVFTSASAIGPLIAGFTIAHSGFAPNFFANAASYLVVLATLFALAPVSAVSAQGASPKMPGAASILTGLKIAAQDRTLTAILSGYALLLFAGPSMQLFLPVFSEHVLRVGPASLGLLFAAFGLGTIAGSSSFHLLSHLLGNSRLFLLAILSWAAALLSIAFTAQIIVSLLMLFLLGGSQTLVAAVAVTLLQTRVLPEMRGRMMSLNTLINMGLRPLGDFPISLMISGFGAPATAAFSALLVGCYSLYLGLSKRAPALSS